MDKEIKEIKKKIFANYREVIQRIKDLNKERSLAIRKIFEDGSVSEISDIKEKIKKLEESKN